MTKGSMGSEKSLHSSSSRGFAMRIKTILPLVVTLAISIWPSAHAGEATEAGQRWGRDKRGGQGEGRLRCGREGSQGGGSRGRPP